MTVSRQPLPVHPGGEHEPMDYNTAQFLSDFKAKDLDTALAALGEAPEVGDTVAHKRRRLEIAATVPSRAEAARKAIWAAVRRKLEADASEYQERLRKELEESMKALRVEYDCVDKEELWVHAEMHQKTVENAARLARGEPAFPNSTDRKDDVDNLQFILRSQWECIPRALLEALGVMNRLREEDTTAALRTCHEALADLSRTTAAVAALLGDDILPAAVAKHRDFFRLSESTKLEDAFRSCVPPSHGRCSLPPAGIELTTRKGVAATAWTALALYAAGACADDALVRAVAADARRFGALRDAPPALTPERASELASAAAARLAAKQYCTPLAELPFPFEERGRAKLNALLAGAGAEK